VDSQQIREAIEKLSPDEQFEIANMILDVLSLGDTSSLPEEAQLELRFRAQHMSEMDKVLIDRLNEYRRNPSAGISWDELKAKLRNSRN
jgi:hypothetical protein